MNCRLYTEFECKMLSQANLPIAYSACWVRPDNMSKSFYNLHCQELNKGEILTKIIVCEFEHVT